MPDAARDSADIRARGEELIAAARRCFDLRLQTNAGGNLSVRLASREAILIKPSGVGFGECEPDQLQLATLDGEVRSSRTGLSPSKDLGFHLEIYRRRGDVNAIVHCHSPWATGYASAGLEIPCLTVQTVEKIGRMPLIPLSPGGGPQTAAEIGPVFDDPSVKAAVMASHGAVAVGATLLAALHLAEIVEETAHIAFVRDALLHARGREAPTAPRHGTAAAERTAAAGGEPGGGSAAVP